MLGQEIVDDEISIRQTLNQIGDNVWEHNFGTGITHFSDTFELILGYDNGEITDKAALWWKITHPDDLHL